MSDQDKPEIHEESAAIPFSEFLESVPPGTLTNITDLAKRRHYQTGGYAGYFQDPDGHLWEVAFNPGISSLG